MSAAVVNVGGLLQRQATSETLLRRAPIICAIASCVSTSLLLPDRSCICQQAARQSRLDRVRRVASGGLLDLRMDSQPVSYQRGPQRCTLVGGHTKPLNIEAGGDARDKHDSFVQRRRITKRRDAPKMLSRPIMAIWTCSPLASLTTREMMPRCGR